MCVVGQMADEDTKDHLEGCEVLDLTCDLSSGAEEHTLGKDETLPETSYDAIIVGTGLVESIVSAALSRIGKTVLHLDKNSYYGSDWSALPLDATSPLGPFQKKWRLFCLDKCPKMVYSRGALVNLLVQSKVSRYLEFHSVGRTLSYIDGKMVEVPCSAADVFNSDLLTLLEKNVIKRFLTFCLSHDQQAASYKDFADKPFKDFLATWPIGKKPQLSSFLQRLILHSIAMCSEEVTTSDGLNATQYYLQSIGRFGNTPFLSPLYGCGEFPQAFCRMSAVFGGVYVLNRFIKSLFVAKDEAEARWLVLTKEYCPPSWFPMATKEEESASKDSEGVDASCSVSRAVLLTAGSISPVTRDGREEPFLLTIPPCEDLKVKSLTHLMELPSSTASCPSGCYIVQLTSLGRNAEEDFGGIIDHFFSRQTPETPVAAGPASEGAVSTSSEPSVGDGREASPPASASDVVSSSEPQEDRMTPSVEESPSSSSPSQQVEESKQLSSADGGATSSLSTNTDDASKDSKPSIFTSMFFNQVDRPCKPVGGDGSELKNVLVVDGPNAELGFISVLKQARAFFDAICPGEEFLPPAPEPEDICYDQPSSPSTDSSVNAEKNESKEGDKEETSTNVADDDEGTHVGGSDTTVDDGTTGDSATSDNVDSQPTGDNPVSSGEAASDSLVPASSS